MPNTPLQDLRAELAPYGAALVAVTKMHGPEEILPLYAQGQRLMGENRVQELLPKYEALPKDIEWHLIGHLQTNKVKAIVPFVHTIQSLDSLRLIMEVEKQAAKAGRRIRGFLQFKVAQEESKYGFALPEVEAFLASGAAQGLRHLYFGGVMGMASLTADTAQVRREFQALRGIFEHLKGRFFAGKDDFCHLSMGMSGDYRIALEEGSTMLRVGSLLFR